VHIGQGRVRIFTRKGLDWTKRFSAIVEAFAGIPVERAIIDGEIVVVEDERTNFGALQADLAAGRQDRMLFYGFDLLYLAGFDLRRLPQIERKRVLKSLYDETGLSAPVLYSEHLETDGAEMLEAARLGGWAWDQPSFLDFSRGPPPAPRSLSGTARSFGRGQTRTDSTSG
jgi:bifunctional non-homologous end joining protein LigD